MDFLEALDKIESNSKLDRFEDGRAKDLEQFWEQFIEPRLPRVEIVEKWHALLMRYINDPDAIFFLRTFGQWENDDNDDRSLRRGFLNKSDIGIDVVYVDNFFTRTFFSLAYDGYVPEYDEFKQIIKLRKIPVRHPTKYTKTEKLKAAYQGEVKADVGSKGYKIAHIFDAGQNFNHKFSRIGQFCSEYFPRGAYEDWAENGMDDSGEYYYRSVHIDPKNRNEVRFYLIAHLLRTIHPINYFLVPTKGKISYHYNGCKKDEIGEFQPLIDYVKEKISHRYGRVYTEFLFYIYPINKSNTQANIVIDAAYYYNKKKASPDSKTRTLKITADMNIGTEAHVEKVMDNIELKTNNSSNELTNAAVNLVNEIRGMFLSRKGSWGMDDTLNYSNEYLDLVRIDSSNHWDDGKLVKMWSIVFKKKRDFTHLETFKVLQSSLDIAVTEVKKGINKGCFGLRIYKMDAEPDPYIVKKILDYLFS